MSAKWSEQSFKGTVADADVLLIIDSEAGPVDNKQVLFSTLKLASQTPWVGDIDGATFNLDNLTSVDLNNTLGTNPIISALQSASESTVVLGSNFQVSSGYIDMAEIATPANPATDVGRLYVKDDGGGITNLFFRDSAGTETDLVSGGGGSPLTTKGDLFGYDTDDNRIPVGTDGQILTADSAEALGVKWGDSAGVTKDPKLFFGNNQAFFPFDETNSFFTLDFGNDGAADADVQYRVPSDTTFSNPTLVVPTNNLDDTFTMTLRVNGANSALVVTVPAANTGTFSSSTSVDLAAGDLVNWAFDATGSTEGELEDAIVSFGMSSGVGGDNPSVYFGLQGLFASFNSTSVYWQLDLEDNYDNEFNAQYRIPADTSFSNFSLVVEANDLDADFILYLRVNGANTASVTVPAATTGTFTSSTPVLISKGDLVNWFADTGSATSGEVDTARISFSFPSESGGNSTPAFFGLNQLFFPFDETDIYRSIDFGNNSNVESEIQYTVPVDTSFSDFTLNVRQNDLDADFTLTLRVNSTSTDGVITVPAGETGNFSSPTSVPLSQNDLINWESNVTGGTIGELQNARVSFSMPTSSGGGTNQNKIGAPQYAPQSAFVDFDADPFFDLWLDNVSITESDISRIVPAPGTYQAFTLNLSSNDFDDTATFTLRKNNADTSVVISIPDATTGTFDSGTNKVEFVKGDTINWSFSSGAATGGSLEDVTLSFEVA